MIKPQDLIDKIKVYDPSVDEALILKAFVFSKKAHGVQKRASGELYFSHPLEVAFILAEMRLDTYSIITALLHDTVEDTLATLDDIRKMFGNQVTTLVDGVTKLSRLELKSEKTQAAENFRKLVLAMSNDIRVLLVKLADRLHNMRTLNHISSPEKRVRIAHETMEIYAPLAERIGMQKLKDEFDDLAFQYLNPDIRDSIINRLSIIHQTSDNIIDQIIIELGALMQEHNIPCTVSGREKTPYSIWRKIQTKQITFEQLSDIMAFRILVNSIPECYQALGIIHAKFPVVSGRFKDFISTPKPNNYKSLHTTLFGPLNQRIEIQIRTHDMHKIAELGVAAHWQYKEDNSFNINDGKQYAWLRGLLEILEETSNPEEFLEHTKIEMFSDKVFCFTPQGDLIALPKKSTPVDFAYAIHSEVGDHAVSAKVNGKIVPLNTILLNSDQVEIITKKDQKPSPTWEQFIASPKAKARIKKVIKSQRKNQYEKLGHKLFNYGFGHLDNDKFEKILNFAVEHFNCKKIQDFYVQLSKGLITLQQIQLALHVHNKTLGIDFSPDSTACLPIQGLTPGMTIHYAKCCHPLPGDLINGVIILNKGMKIHTKDCEIVSNFTEPERLINVCWESNPVNTFIARSRITFANLPGSLASTTSTISNYGGNIINIKVLDRSPDFWVIFIDIEVKSKNHLDDIVGALNQLKIVNHVERI